MKSPTTSVSVTTGWKSWGGIDNYPGVSKDLIM
jgi:hypothetical protein